MMVKHVTTHQQRGGAVIFRSAYGDRRELGTATPNGDGTYTLVTPGREPIIAKTLSIARIVAQSRS